MTRAVVLGGGGPVGIAWECGLLTSLLAGSVPLADADVVIGTSAGSIVGAALAGHADLPALAAALTQPLPVPPGRPVDLAAMQTAIAQATVGAPSSRDAMIAVGALAAASPTVSEDEFVARTTAQLLEGLAWPPALRCTAIDIATGDLVVLGPQDGVELARATAASCAVPMIFPPVTVAAARCIDGGMLSPLNATIATGHDTVLVVSCFALDVPDDFPTAAVARLQRAELDAVRATGSDVVLVQPDQEFNEISGWGAEVMNPDRTPPAYQAGRRLGATLVDAVQRSWGVPTATT